MFQSVQYWLVQQLAKWCKQGTMIAFQNTSYYGQCPLNRMCTQISSNPIGRRNDMHIMAITPHEQIMKCYWVEVSFINRGLVPGLHLRGGFVASFVSE